MNSFCPSISPGFSSGWKPAVCAKGFACLFYGAPGTGKTETVYQLARRTGRNLMVVDVAQIKSCWVGESEKNIRKAFERYRAYVKEAERAPILLFNEADAVLGIRQEGPVGLWRRWRIRCRTSSCRRWSSWTAS
ncbi:MAG: AAA family ATPase [Alistipes shahii]